MRRPDDILSREELWPRAAEVTRRALADGALEPITTRPVIVADGGLPFIVHVRGEALARKTKARREQVGSGVNPFLPPDPELLVGCVSPTHLAVLNKFNVIADHLLLVTRRFVPQEEPLDLADLDAAARAMAGVDGLAFYNGGSVGGASQPHKHLQVIPLPLGPGPAPTPLDVLLDGADLPAQGAGRIDRLPFVHAVRALPDPADRVLDPGRLLAAARELLDAVGVGGTQRPYNLLITRRWMLAVPRVRERAGAVSINALGFAGSLLARDADELEWLRRRGPMSLLVEVAGGREA